MCEAVEQYARERAEREAKEAAREAAKKAALDEAREAATRLFQNGASFELVSNCIVRLSSEELRGIYQEVC